MTSWPPGKSRVRPLIAIETRVLLASDLTDDDKPILAELLHEKVAPDAYPPAEERPLST